MRARSNLDAGIGRALGRLSLRLLLTSGVLGGWLGLWWVLHQARSGAL